MFVDLASADPGLPGHLGDVLAVLMHERAPVQGLKFPQGVSVRHAARRSRGWGSQVSS